MRKHLSKGLGFSRKDRDENIRRIGFVAGLLTRNGVIALAAAISPYRAVRDEVRASIGDFVEVYVNAPLEVCEARDPKGLYRKARAGNCPAFTGIDDPYEPPRARSGVPDRPREPGRMHRESAGRHRPGAGAVGGMIRAELSSAWAPLARTTRLP